MKAADDFSGRFLGEGQFDRPFVASPSVWPCSLPALDKPGEAASPCIEPRMRLRASDRSRLAAPEVEACKKALPDGRPKVRGHQDQNAAHSMAGSKKTRRSGTCSVSGMPCEVAKAPSTEHPGRADSHPALMMSRGFSMGQAGRHEGCCDFGYGYGPPPGPFPCDIVRPPPPPWENGQDIATTAAKLKQFSCFYLVPNGWDGQKAFKFDQV